MKRSRLRSRRPTPRRRPAGDRWTAAEWQDASNLLYLRSGGHCEHCGRPLAGSAERHHRRRRRSGGDTLSNLLLVLPECHAAIHAFPETSRGNGWIVSAFGGEPAGVPVWHRGRRLMLLDDAGGLAAVDSTRTP